MEILLIYSSHDGQTKKIMQFIANELCEKDPSLTIKLQNIIHEPDVALNNIDAVIIGTSIRYGHYHKEVRRFIDKNTQEISAKPNAFFGINLIARKHHKRTPETNSYTRKFLSSIRWKPQIAAVFAGALNYPKYNILDKLMIKLIMKITKGETNTTKTVEYTDWHQVKQFVCEFYSLLAQNTNYKLQTIRIKKTIKVKH